MIFTGRQTSFGLSSSTLQGSYLLFFCLYFFRGVGDGGSKTGKMRLEKG